MADLSGVRVAVLATDGFEESELLEPVKALKEAGAAVTIVSPKAGEIQGMRMDREWTVKIPVDRTVADLRADDFDAVHLPGGTLNADAMRAVPEVKVFLRDMQVTGKPIAAICHAPWELISAELVHGRTLTSYHTLKDDVVNAGGLWEDWDVVNDDNWVTSRSPADLPVFIRGMLALFSRCLDAKPVA